MISQLQLIVFVGHTHLINMFLGKFQSIVKVISNEGVMDKNTINVKNIGFITKNGIWN